MPSRLRLSEALAAALALLLAAACGSRARPSASLSNGPPPDVVLVTIDTLRADAPGYAGNRKVATPVLDALAREGAVFTRAYAHAVVTLPSHASILTGLTPRVHGIHDNEGFRLDA